MALSLAIDAVCTCASLRPPSSPNARPFSAVLAVADVLEDIQVDVENVRRMGRNTQVARHLKLLTDAAEEATTVLVKCSNKKAAFFGREYIAKLDKAKADISEALGLLQGSMQISVKEDIADVQVTLKELDSRLQRSNHALTTELREILVARDGQMRAQMIEFLTKQCVVSDKDDFEIQLQEIQENEKTLLEDKALFDRELVESVMQLSLTESFPPTIQIEHKELDPQVTSILECPISLQLMRDPVVLQPGGQTMDRESLCKWLSIHPNTDPISMIEYDEPLSYFDNIAVRKMLMQVHGDASFVRFDDAEVLAN